MAIHQGSPKILAVVVSVSDRCLVGLFREPSNTFRSSETNRDYQISVVVFTQNPLDTCVGCYFGYYQSLMRCLLSTLQPPTRAGSDLYASTKLDIRRK